MINPNQYAITFACYNALNYTKLCIDSMVKSGTPLERLVIVDNGSHDGTQEYLQNLSVGRKIFNTQNLGCGVAWNQGALALQAEWTIIMNNDVIVSPLWIEKLIGAAVKLGVKLASPALIEGALDYDFIQFESGASKIMELVNRPNQQHAVCLAVHSSVWQEIGYFAAVPKLLGFEDTLFFNEAKKSKISGALVGASWLHHFGSITQSLIKVERGLSKKAGLGDRHNFKLLQQSWFERKFNKFLNKRQTRLDREHELAQFGMTLHGVREEGKFVWL